MGHRDSVKGWAKTLNGCRCIPCNGPTTCNSQFAHKCLGNKAAGSFGRYFTNIYHRVVLIILSFKPSAETEVMHNSKLHGEMTMNLEQVRTCIEAVVVVYFRRQTQGH